MKIKKITSLLVLPMLAVFINPLQYVLAEPSMPNWLLPQIISDENAVIGFELDTTWHTVHGKTSSISGKSWLADPANPASVNVLIELPVAKFDTNNKSRDEEMRDVMTEDKYPKVVFTASGLTKGCTPEKVIKDGSCDDSLQSELQIRDVKKPLLVPVKISSDKGGFAVSGKVPVKWADYGVKDPSLFLIASVDPIAEIHFSIMLHQVS